MDDADREYFNTTPFGVYIIVRKDKEFFPIQLPPQFEEDHVGFQMSPHRAFEIINGLQRSYDESLEKTRKKMKERLNESRS